MATPDPVAATTPSTGDKLAANLCECGHPPQTHYAMHTPGAPGPCTATVYIRVGSGATGGMNASPCNCRAFRRRGPRVYA